MTTRPRQATRATESPTTPRSGEDMPPSLPPFLVLPLAQTPAGLRRAPAVVAIAVTSFVVVGIGQASPRLLQSLQASTAHLADGQLWRLLTYVFPHEHGWWHVIANMAILALFGWQLEQLIGTARFLLIYFGSGAIGLALVFTANPIDAERSLRGGASLAVFGTVAALVAIHAAVDGRRSPALPWVIPTCLVLLIAAGALSLPGRGEVIEQGLEGFQVGFVNHTAGMAAGLLLGIAVPPHCSPIRRWTATATAAGALVGGLAIGIARWS